MTRQVTEGSPITVTARSQVGGFIPDAPLSIDGQVFKDPGLSESFDEHRTNGAGDFVFYAAPGSVITVTVGDPIATDLEPIQVVGVTGRPGGLAAVHPDDTPAVHEASPISEHVTDSSLVGAVGPADALPEDQGGAAAAVGVDKAQNVPPAPVDTPSPQTPQEAIDAQVAAFPVDTPDGTAATDPDSVAPPSVQPEQVTPMFEPQPSASASTVAPETVTTVDAPAPNVDGGASTAQDVHGADSPAVDPPVDPNTQVGTQMGEPPA